MASEVILTSRILASVLATMFMPSLDDDVVIGLDQSPDGVQLFCREAMIRPKLDRLKPELAVLLLAPDVNANRLIAVEAVEEDPIGAWDVLDSRQSPVPPLDASLAQRKQCTPVVAPLRVG